MKVRVLKMFSSAVIGGNHKRGDVIDLTDAYGKHLIQHGLAEEVETATNEEAQKMIDSGEAEIPEDAIVDPTQPAMEETPGASLPADQVSQKKTVTKSKSGGQKVKKGKSRS